MNYKILKIMLIWMIAISCRQREEGNTPTSGELRIICDESVSSVFVKQGQEFQKSYPKARLDIKLGTTNYAIGSLLNNQVECIISTRELDSAETVFLIRHDIKVYSQKLALDGIAFIVNVKNPVDELDLDLLRGIFTGKINRWHDIADTVMRVNHADGIATIIDGTKSGNYVLIQNQVMDGEALTMSAIIVPGDSVTSSSERILSYIASHEDAIGYVSSAWLGNDPVFAEHSANLKVLRLSETNYQNAVAPIPGYVYRGDYPLRRIIYVMHRQKHVGLAAGFTAFLAGNEGQRIFLNSNLVPAMNPVRLKKE